MIRTGLAREMGLLGLVATGVGAMWARQST